MGNVRKHVKDKLAKDEKFKARYDIMQQKLEVAKKIIAYRLQHDLSQKQLANELGVSQQYISKIEEGRFSTLEMVDSVLNHIGYHLTITVEPWRRE